MCLWGCPYVCMCVCWSICFFQFCEEQDIERYRTLHDEMWHLCNILSTTCVKNHKVNIAASMYDNRLAIYSSYFGHNSELTTCMNSVIKMNQWCNRWILCKFLQWWSWIPLLCRFISYQCFCAILFLSVVSLFWSAATLFAEHAGDDANRFMWCIS